MFILEFAFSLVFWGEEFAFKKVSKKYGEGSFSHSPGILNTFNFVQFLVL